MYLLLTIVVFSIQGLVVLSESNPICNPDLTIDSAFVDKYSDLGSDVITLFADNTVYKLSVSATDPLNPIFRYNGSQHLKEWAKGIAGPISDVYYQKRGEIIHLINYKISYSYDLWSHNKTIKSINNQTSIKSRHITVEKLIIKPYERTQSKIYYDKDITVGTIYNKGSEVAINEYYLIPELKNKTHNNLTIDEIRSYMNETTAGFAFNDYFYLFAGNRVCRMNNRTLEFADNCLNQTIAQWIRCGEMEDKTFPWLMIIIISVTLILILMTALMACLMYRVMTEEEEDITSKPEVYTKYKTVDQNVDTLQPRVSTTSLSSASSDNRPTELTIQRSNV